MFKWKNKKLDGFEQEKIKKNFLPYSILVVALFAMTFFGVCDPNTGGPTGVKGPAAYLGSDTISRREFVRAYTNQESQMRSQYGEDYDAAKLRPAETTLNQLVAAHIDYAHALELGVVSSEDQVYKFLANADAFKNEKGEFDKESFDVFLRNNRYTEASFFNEYQRYLTVQRLRSLITASTFVSSDSIKFDYLLSETKMNLDYLEVEGSKVEVKVTPKQIDDFLANPEEFKKVEEYFSKNSQEFNRPERVKASHILVAYKDARNATGDALKRDKNEAKELAEKVLLEVKKPGADFAALAKKYTDEASGKTSGGDLGFFTKDMMVKEFSDAAFQLEKGQVSSVTESPFGFHIIKSIDREKALNKTIDEVKSQIAKVLIEQIEAPKAAKNMADQIIADLKADKNVDALLTEQKLAWKKTGGFAISSGFIPGLGISDAIRTAVLNDPAAGKLIDTVMTVGQKHYIVKIASIQEAKESELDGEVKERLASTAGMSQGYTFYTALSREHRSAFEKRNAIKFNDSYLQLDRPVAN